MDEDIDPLIGPMADLMAEHQLSTTINDISKSIEKLEEKTNLFNSIPMFNIRLVFQNIFNYFLNIFFYYYLKQYSSNIEQETSLHQSTLYSSLKTFIILTIFYIILTLPFSLIIHLLPGIYICYILIIDFLFPLFIYSNWFRCLYVIRQWINVIQIHQQWLIKIHGFQLIRPTSSLFESQLYKLRRTIFEELRKHFLYTRQITRQYSSFNNQLICYIDLNEFGPLIQYHDIQLEQITNQFDQISINSILKLCHLQINECIQIIHLYRPKSYWIFHNYQTILLQSIDNLNRIKWNCSIMIDYIDIEKSSTNKLISTYFLLRSNCEQLFNMNETNSINFEELKRIIQDLKTVLYSLEAIQMKPITTIKSNSMEQILSNEISSSNISSYHRFDDQLTESIDEILMCDTGNDLNDEIIDNNHEIYDYDQRLLREQTHYLMKELQTAIEGKKQEWNEREQRLLGHIEEKENLIEKKSPIINEQESFEKISSIKTSISMLDELKHSFILNRKKLHLDEDIFGEDEQMNFDDE